jgi:hypothetical protein
VSLSTPRLKTTDKESNLANLTSQVADSLVLLTTAAV